MNIWNKAVKGQEQKDRETLASHGIPDWVIGFADAAYAANENPLPALRKILPGVHWSANGGFHHDKALAKELGRVVVSFAVGSQLGIQCFRITPDSE